MIALIIGITGQDGKYLTEFLLEKGYKVYGIKRRTSCDNMGRLKDVIMNVNLKIFECDITDSMSIYEIVKQVMPDEIYNLAAQSHVGTSFKIPNYTNNVDGEGTLNVLRTITNIKEKQIKFYQASTSELFGKVQQIPQNEMTPFYPRSPYAIAKLYAYWMTVNFREAYGIYACNGILFNHESPYRGSEFVTKKVVRNVIKICNKEITSFYVGNLDAKRDWGYAKDYVKAMWLMLQQEKADDYVIATGECHSVREFIEEAFRCVNIEIIWRGKGIQEEGINKKTGDVLVKVDPQLFRPAEVEVLIGDSKKAQKVLGWKPRTTFKRLIEIMIEAEKMSYY